MSLESAIENFCYRSKAIRKQAGNAVGRMVTGCSRGSRYSHDNMLSGKELLIEFVKKAYGDLPISSTEDIDELFSVEDEQNILDGTFSEAFIHAHIKAWINDGMPYHSGKKGL